LPAAPAAAAVGGRALKMCFGAFFIIIYLFSI
jgi:hypothetical protein